MRKIRTVVLALVAVFAFSAMAASSASAAVWTTTGGVTLTKIEPAVTKGFVLLHHTKIPALFGGGAITVKCEGKFEGVVGGFKGIFNAAQDETKTVVGPKGETKKIDCNVTETTNSICNKLELVLVEPQHLPWKTELKGVAPIFDEILNGGTGEPGYETTCKGIGISCTGKDRSENTANTASGATFVFHGELKASCTDGGEGTVLGEGTTEKFNVK